MAAWKDEAVTTLEELRALPDDGLRHEMLAGVHAVTPSPPPVHQRVLWEMTLWLARVLENVPHLQAYSSPSDVQLDKRSLVQPDLFVVSRSPGPLPDSWSEIDLPVLAVEILSPSTAARDRGIKRELYQAAGVAEYWIVDIDAQLVERWTPQDARPEIDRERLWWTPPGTDRAVELDVATLFARALGDGAEG